MRKRFLAALLTFCLCFNSVIVFAASDYADINDVPWEGSKFYINSVTQLGIMGGDTNEAGQKVFRARDKVNLCETMQIIYNVFKKSHMIKGGANLSGKYQSVLNKYYIPQWAQEATAYGLENGIVSESDVSLFMLNPQKHRFASREQVAVMMGKGMSSMYSINRSAVLSYKDAGLLQRSSVAYVDLLLRLKIMQGDIEGNFNPISYINRAEMAVLASKSYSVLTENTAPSTIKTNDPAKGQIVGISQYNVQISSSDSKIKSYPLTDKTSFKLEGFSSSVSEIISAYNSSKDKEVIANVILDNSSNVKELSVTVGGEITHSGNIAFMTDNFFKLELSDGKTVFLQRDLQSISVTLDGIPTSYSNLLTLFNSKTSRDIYKANITVVEGVIKKIVAKKV